MLRRELLIGLAIALALAIFSFLASPYPDGLERVAQDQNFFERATESITSPLSNYLFPGVADKKLANALAGIAGVLLVFGLSVGLFGILRKKR